MKTQNLLLTLIVAVLVLYLPLLLFFYWLTHVRRHVSANRQVIRTKELSFFFMRTLDEQWKLVPHLLVSLLPSLMLAAGGYLAMISLTTMLKPGDELSAQALSISLDAVEKYVRPVFFGFLGAYLFMLQTTMRRYLDDDLGIDTHIVITVRVIMALIVSFVGGFLLPEQYNNMSLGVILVYGAAFVFGVMPERGFETLYGIVTRWLGDQFKRDEGEPGNDLQKALGFDRVRMARLSVENIKTVEDMAYVEIERLAQKTRFDLQSIFHWVDRSVFCSQLRDSPSLKTLEENGIRTFSAFENIHRDSQAHENIQMQISGIPTGQEASAEEGQRSESIAATGNLDLDVAYTAMRQIPNTELVRLFTRYKGMQVTGSFEYANRAMAYEKMGRHEQAIAEYDEALERNPLDPTLLTRRGHARAQYAQRQMRKGNFETGHRAFDRALRDFQGALDIIPSWWEARVQRAITLLDQKPYLFDHIVVNENLKRAATDLEQARKRNAKELEIVNWLGKAYLAQGRHQEVTSLLRKALQPGKYQAPRSVKATAELVAAQALMAQAQHAEDGKDLLEQAYSHMLEARGLMPRSALLFQTVARYYHMQNPGSKQEERYLELALQAGDTAAVGSDVGLSASSLRDHDKREVQDEIYEMWGQLNLDRGDAQAALACFAQALALNPARATSYAQRGALYERLGDLDGAIADYTLLIENMGCETADTYLARARAQSLASMRQPERAAQAERDLERALAVAPDRPEPLIAWGHWQRLGGDYQEAVDSYDQAEDLLSEIRDKADIERVQVDLNVGRGLAYSGLNDRVKARKALRKADRLVGGERNRPTTLWIGWGVLNGLETDDPEAQMQAQDAFAHLAEEGDWTTAGAADLVQMRDSLATLTSGSQAPDRELQIKLDIAQIRAAASLGTSDLTDKTDKVHADISALASEQQKAALNALLANADQLGQLS